MKTFLRTLGLIMLFAGSVLSGCGGGNDTNAAPVILSQPTSQRVAVGSSVTLTVAIAGDGNTYQWYKDGVAIPGATNASYTILSTVLTNTGTYYAVVTNAFGNVTSQSATITVTTTPTGTNGGSVVTVN
ncbi:MAG: immunoglobulin domain-containing protein [Armatimonas sp.]